MKIEALNRLEGAKGTPLSGDFAIAFRSLLPPNAKKAEGGGYYAELKFGEPRKAQADKLMDHLKVSLNKMGFKALKTDYRESMGYINKGATGDSVYRAGNLQYTLKRSYSYSNGTTYFTLSLKEL